MTSMMYCHLVGERSVVLRPRKWTAVSASAGRVIQKRYKSRCVVLGAGWVGFRLAKDLDKSQYDVTVISPRNHFLFTPLLPSTSVGTLEFRCVQEPVRTIKGKYCSYTFLGDVLYVKGNCYRRKGEDNLLVLTVPSRQK